MAMERMYDKTSTDRRELLRSAGRVGCLAALAGLGGWLGARGLRADGGPVQRESIGSAAECPRRRPCAACPLAGRCTLPQAQAAREEGRP